MDKHLGKTLTYAALRQKPEGLHSGTTKQRLTKIPLVVGMPVMIAQNFDVQGGVVTGSQGKSGILMTMLATEFCTCALLNFPSQNIIKA